MLRVGFCGIRRTEKLKGGGVHLKTPKECQGQVIFHETIDPLLLVGKCNVCKFQHYKKLEPTHA